MLARLITLVTALGIATFALPAIVAGVGVAPEDSAAPVSAQEGGTTQIDDNDDTRVAVQLVVLGLAIAVVLVLGGVGYLVRRRLGLDKPPGEEAASHH